MTKVINFIAPPCRGKTTISALLYGYMKLSGFKVEYIQEYAKSLIFSDRKDELNNQLKVNTEQYISIKNLQGKTDYIIVDGSLFNGLVYNVYNKENICDIRKTEKKIVEQLREFENIFFYIEENKEITYENIGRVHSKDEVKNLEQLFNFYLYKYKIEYIKITCNLQNVEKILERLK